MGAEAIHKLALGVPDGTLSILSEIGTPRTNSTVDQTTVDFTSVTVDGDYIVVAVGIESEVDTSARITGVTIDPAGAAIAATELISQHATNTDTDDAAIFVADVSALASGSYTVRVTIGSPGSDSCVMYCWNLVGGTDPTTAYLTKAGSFTSTASSFNIAAFDIPEDGIAFAIAAVGSQASSAFVWGSLTKASDYDTGGGTDDHTGSFAAFDGERASAVESVSWTGTSSKGAGVVAVLQ